MIHYRSFDIIWRVLRAFYKGVLCGKAEMLTLVLHVYGV